MGPVIVEACLIDSNLHVIHESHTFSDWLSLSHMTRWAVLTLQEGGRVVPLCRGVQCGAWMCAVRGELLEREGDLLLFAHTIVM